MSHDERRTIIDPKPTTFISSHALNQAVGANVLIAFEGLQYTGSFKYRAAQNLVASVPQQHIITVSSGNFGQALAFACMQSGKRCSVVMPATSAAVKITSVRGYSADVVLVDTTVMTRAQRLAQLASEYPDAYVASAYDDDFVIAGNASLGREIARSGIALDAVIAPVGGGGLLSGLILGLRDGDVAIPVFGAEPSAGGADAMQSLQRGEIVANTQEPDTIADGARTPSLGKRNWAVLKDNLTGVMPVGDAAIREGVRLLFSFAKIIAEPTGALPIGALLSDPDRFHGKNVCCVVTGANVDPERYAEILLNPSAPGP